MCCWCSCRWVFWLSCSPPGFEGVVSLEPDGREATTAMALTPAVEMPIAVRTVTNLRRDIFPARTFSTISGMVVVGLSFSDICPPECMLRLHKEDHRTIEYRRNIFRFTKEERFPLYGPYCSVCESRK